MYVTVHDTNKEGKNMLQTEPNEASAGFKLNNSKSMSYLGINYRPASYPSTKRRNSRHVVVWEQERSFFPSDTLTIIYVC